MPRMDSTFRNVVDDFDTNVEKWEGAKTWDWIFPRTRRVQRHYAKEALISSKFGKSLGSSEDQA